MSKLNEKELLKELDKAVGFKVAAYKQIRELIKIFFAKEISAGPIKKDISQPDLIKWLQGINQAATAVKDYYVMKATTQLIKIIQQGIPILWEHDRFQTLEKEGKLPEKRALTIDEVISKYPESVRILLNGLVQKLDVLEKMLGEKPAVDEGFVNTWAKEFQADTPADSSLNERLVKKLLIEAGVDVIKI